MVDLLRRGARLFVQLVLVEVALYRCLGRWLVRRPDVPAGSTPLGYAQLAAPMLWLFIVGNAVEVVAVHLLLHRWPAIQLPALVIGIWSVLWMLGLLAAYRMRPHLLFDDELVVRSGGRLAIRVPRAAIVETRATEHDLTSSVRSLQIDDDLLLVGVSGRTNLELILAEPTALATSRGLITAHTVGLWVDDPRATTALLRPGIRGAAG